MTWEIKGMNGEIPQSRIKDSFILGVIRSRSGISDEELTSEFLKKYPPRTPNGRIPTIAEDYAHDYVAKCLVRFEDSGLIRRSDNGHQAYLIEGSKLEEAVV